MIGLIRWTALILEFSGLYETLMLGRQGRYSAAFLFLLFDAGLVIAFVTVHGIVEWVLQKQSPRRGGIWWL